MCTSHSTSTHVGGRDIKSLKVQYTVISLEWARDFGSLDKHFILHCDQTKEIKLKKAVGGNTSWSVLLANTVYFV